MVLFSICTSTCNLISTVCILFITLLYPKIMKTLFIRLSSVLTTIYFALCVITIIIIVTAKILKWSTCSIILLFNTSSVWLVPAQQISWLVFFFGNLQFIVFTYIMQPKDTLLQAVLISAKSCTSSVCKAVANSCFPISSHS